MAYNNNYLFNVLCVSANIAHEFGHTVFGGIASYGAASGGPAAIWGLYALSAAPGILFPTWAYGVGGFENLFNVAGSIFYYDGVNIGAAQ